MGLQVNLLTGRIYDVVQRIHELPPVTFPPSPLATPSVASSAVLAEVGRGGGRRWRSNPSLTSQRLYMLMAPLYDWFRVLNSKVP